MCRLCSVAKSVIRGDYGNGDERYVRLTLAGYDYNKIQRIVNNMLDLYPSGVIPDYICFNY